MGQKSRNSLIIVRSQWDLIGSPRADQPFRQCASHLPHEGNPENIFSMAESRSTYNTQPSMSRLMTETASNKKLYKPDVADIWRRYQAGQVKGMRVYVDGEVNSVHEGIIIRIRNNQVLTLFGSIRLFVNYVPWSVRLQQSAVFWVHCNSGDLGSFLGCLFKTLMLV